MKYETMSSTIAAVELLFDWNNMTKEKEKEFLDNMYVAELTTRFPKPLPQLTCYVRLKLKHLAVFTHDFMNVKDEEYDRVRPVEQVLIRILSEALVHEMISEKRENGDVSASPLYQLMLSLRAVKHEQFPHIEDKIDAFLVPSYSVGDKVNLLCEILQDDKFFPVFGFCCLKNEEGFEDEYDLSQIISEEYMDKLIADFGIDISPVTNRILADYLRRLVQFNMTREVLLRNATEPVTDEYVNDAISSMCDYFEHMTSEKRRTLEEDEDAQMADMMAHIQEFKKKKELSQREKERKQKQRERDFRKKADRKRKKK